MFGAHSQCRDMVFALVEVDRPGQLCVVFVHLRDRHVLARDSVRCWPSELCGWRLGQLLDLVLGARGWRHRPRWTRS